MVLGERKNILLVEDDILIACNTKYQLEKKGYNVIHVQNGKMALQYISEEIPVDTILMDIDLGSGINGINTAIEILKLRTIPVIFLSSQTDPVIIEMTTRITSYGLINNKFDFTLIVSAIEQSTHFFVPAPETSHKAPP